MHPSLSLFPNISLTCVLVGHSQLGRRAEVASSPVRHWYLAYSCQRFQGLARFRRPSSLHHREVRRGDTAPQVTHVFQPPRFASLQDVRRAYAEAHVGRRGDGWFRTGVGMLTSQREEDQKWRVCLCVAVCGCVVSRHSLHVRTSRIQTIG